MPDDKIAKWNTAFEQWKYHEELRSKRFVYYATLNAILITLIAAATPGILDLIKGIAIEVGLFPDSDADANKEASSLLAILCFSGLLLTALFYVLHQRATLFVLGAKRALEIQEAKMECAPYCIMTGVVDGKITNIDKRPPFQKMLSKFPAADVEGLVLVLFFAIWSIMLMQELACTKELAESPKCQLIVFVVVLCAGALANCCGGSSSPSSARCCSCVPSSGCENCSICGREFKCDKDGNN